ncbi:AAA family ATPase [Escherichia coli]|nr:AAA family ATPase [Escherichia coli]
MRVKVNNFGTISQADVSIGGLTVITGENDTGKSTIGKILFSMVKAISRYEEDLEEDKEVQVTSLVERIYFNLRRRINIISSPEIRDLFNPRRFYALAKNDLYNTLHDREMFIRNLVDKNELSELVADSCYDYLRKIRELMIEPEDEQSAISRALRKAFFSEFRGEIIQKGHTSPIKASLEVVDGASPLIDIKWTREGMSHFKYTDALGYSDATYVDSPSVIQYHNLVGYAKTLFDNETGRMTVPLHVKDLISKLSDSVYTLFPHADLFGDTSHYNEALNISQKINNTFHGEVTYDTEQNEFFLEKKGYKVTSSNIASGIKSLGILDMLIKGGSATYNSLLIIDEPEVNLHPKWQIFYAEIVCELVSMGVDIIITTHSPYIIDALKHYSDKTGIENHFYLTERFPDEDYTYFVDITHNISLAINLLAAPLRDLNQEYLDDF